MSIAQMAQFLGHVSRHQEIVSKEERVYSWYFAYDNNYLWHEFLSKFPNSTAVGIGWLPGWTWHLNSKGKENIRYNYLEKTSIPKGPVCSPASTFTRPKYNGVFGWIFQISPEDEAKLDKTFAFSRVRMVQEIQLIVNGQRTTSKALIYFDPFDTVDSVNENVWEVSTEANKWLLGLAYLKAAGVPPEYILTIQRRMTGTVVDAEPLISSKCIDPAKLKKRSSPQRIQRIQHREEPAIERQSGRTLSPPTGLCLPQLLPKVVGPIKATCKLTIPRPQSRMSIINGQFRPSQPHPEEVRKTLKLDRKCAEGQVERLDAEVKRRKVA